MWNCEAIYVFCIDCDIAFIMKIWAKSGKFAVTRSDMWKNNFYNLVSGKINFRLNYSESARLLPSPPIHWVRHTVIAAKFVGLDVIKLNDKKLIVWTVYDAKRMATLIEILKMTVVICCRRVSFDSLGPILCPALLRRRFDFDNRH